MSDTALKKGDVVQLKSGVPKMTVTGVGNGSMTGEAIVPCTWFGGTKQLDGDFPPETLEKFEPSPSTSHLAALGG
jgi:uncharacterized protein YodC (DUF2158 family)